MTKSTLPPSSPSSKKSPVSFVRPSVRRLVAYHLDRHDVPVKLDQNENNWGVPETLREDWLEALRSCPLHRYPSPDQMEIRATLAKMNDWHPDGILVGNGLDDLLHSVAMTFLEPGRRALVPQPSFFVYAYTSQLMDAEVVEVPLTATLEYDPDAVLGAIEESEPDVVYLCSPNNPTGTVLEPSAVEAIAERAPGIVVLDEAYWEFHSWNARPLLETHPNLILCRTFSKAMAMAGMRLGFLMTSPELALEIRKTQQPYTLNRASEEAARAALKHFALLRERASGIVRERERLLARLSTIEGIEAFPSKANFLLFRTAKGAARTFEGLLERGVLVRDVSHYPRLSEMLRAGVGTEQENDALVEALERTMEVDP